MDTVRDLGGIRGDAYYRLIHTHSRNDKKSRSHSHVVSPEQVHEDGHAPAEGCLFRPRCTQAVEACRREDPLLVKSGKVWGPLSARRDCRIAALSGNAQIV
jgi:peptide/nickel transport system ATP-binding protein